MYSVSCLTFILPMADSVRKLCVCVCMCVLFIINVLISMYLILSVILSTVCHFMYLCLSMICILITSYLSPCFNRFSSIWNHFVGVQNILYALNVLWWSLAWILLIVLCDCLHISIFFLSCIRIQMLDEFICKIQMNTFLDFYASLLIQTWTRYFTLPISHMHSHIIIWLL